MEQHVQEELNKQVANWSVLYIKFHNYHWYVKGDVFFDLHKKFEELYHEADKILDELAERLLAIGGQPVATFPDILANTSLQEAKGNESAEQMVTQLVQDFQQLSNELREAIEKAEQAKDYSTVDLLTGILKKLEKHNWLFQAFLDR